MSPAEREACKEWVLEGVYAGESLTQLCERDDAITTRATVCRMIATDPEFQTAYNHAVAAAFLVGATDCFHIVDDKSGDVLETTITKVDKSGKEVTKVTRAPNIAAVHRARLQIDLRKWALSKIHPQLSDKLTDLLRDAAGMDEGGELVVMGVKLGGAKKGEDEGSDGAG